MKNCPKTILIVIILVLNEEDDIYDDYQRELEKARTDLPS